MKKILITLFLIQFQLFAASKDDFILNCAFSKSHNFNAIKLNSELLFLTPFQLYLYRALDQNNNVTNTNITLLYGAQDTSTKKIASKILSHRFNKTDIFNDIYSKSIENIYLGERAFISELLVSWKNLPEEMPFSEISFSLKREENYHCQNNQIRRRMDGTLNLKSKEYEITCVQTAAFRDPLKIWDCIN